MTADDYERQLETWCEDLKAEALRLFDSGVLPAECTGLAIQVVESRRKKTLASQQRLLAGVQPPRGH